VLKDQPKAYPGYFYSKADSIDLQEFLKSFDNFGQQAFTAENTTGKLSWASHYYFKMNEDLSLNENENFVIFNSKIYDAAFDQVEPIQKALFFVGSKSKDKMVVKNLDVNAFLSKNEIYFTDILMNDNIANLDVCGEVDLKNKELEIGVQISLSDLFFRSKAKRLVQTEAGEVDLENDSKVFLKMDGEFSDHKLGLTNQRKFEGQRSDLLAAIKKAQKEFKSKQPKK
jgi:hypothetical protein